MKKTKILITGAGGQLGSELTQALRNIYGQDAVITSDIKKAEGILAEGPHEKFDVMNNEQLLKIISKHEITQIYHLAALLSATGEKDPMFAWQLNMNSLLSILEAARTLKLDKLFWPSSIAVFGPNTPNQHTPQSSYMDPSTVYGISKLAGERWCEYYFYKYGIDVRSVRYPGLIGYKTAAGGGTTDYAVEIFHKAIKDKKYECFLLPDTYLPMMYMDDAIKATLDLMHTAPETVRIRSSYNIGSMSFSPSELAAEIVKYIPDFAIHYKPDFRQKIAESWPKSIDDKEARNDWGWKPTFDIMRMTEEILKGLAVEK
jgi:nucleoside-diphosphate-sugar epimerase